MHLTIFSRPGGGARQADGAHDGFGAAVDESDHFNGRHGGGDLGGQLGFQFRRRPEAGSASDGFRQGGDDAVVGVSDDQRAVAGDVIDVGIPIDIRDDGSLALP